MASRRVLTALIALFALHAACKGLQSSPSMNSIHQREARAFIERWDKGYINGAELLAAVRGACPGCPDQDLRAALDAVARGPLTAASACAAAALCQVAGLGDPLDLAYRLFNEGGRTLTEPQWFAWIAGYSYNWVCNAGLSACYFDFDDRQFADRIRVYLGEQVKTGQLRSLQNRPVEGRRRTLCNGSTRRNKRARIGDLSNTLSIPFALSPAVRGQLRPPGFTGAAAPAASPEQRGAAPGQGAACKRRDRATRARRLLGSARRGSQSADSWSARSVRVRKLLGPHLSTLA
jgi:hypothetical protein